MRKNYLLKIKGWVEGLINPDEWKDIPTPPSLEAKGEKIHINYAHNCCEKSQPKNSKTAIEVGGFDRSIQYKYEDIDKEFADKNKHILSQGRGAGFWLWKPYFILKTLRTMNEKDVLLYTDSGSFFVDSFDAYIEFLHEIEEGLVAFTLGHPNRQFCKRDAFILMDMDEEEHVNAPQNGASFMFCKKTPFTIAFFEEFLEYAQDERILTDLENTQGLPNYPDFNDHRHDQAIYSLLLLKHGMQNKIVRDPSQWGGVEGWGEQGHRVSVALEHNREKG